MAEESMWQKHTIDCPEGKGTAELVSAWRVDDGVEVLVGVSCNNQELKDPAGKNCQWSCWDQVAKEAKPPEDSV